MYKTFLFLLYLIIFVNYTQGMLIRSGVGFASRILELLVIALCISQIGNLFKKQSGQRVFLFVIISGLLTSIVSGTVLSFFQYSRFFFYFYAIYSIVWNTKIDYEDWNKLLRYMLLIVLAQGIGSLYTYFTIGKVEGYVGLMSALGGTTAVAFPTLIIGLCLSLYFEIGSFSTKKVLLLLCIFASMLCVSFVSEKRAIIVMVPATATALFCCIVFRKRSNRYYGRSVIKAIAFSAIVLSFSTFYISSTMERFVKLSGREGITELADIFMDYTNSYESATAQGGSSVGRTGTTEAVMTYSFRHPKELFFGSGFMSTEDEDVLYRLGTLYGIVGFIHNLINGGIIYSILIVVLFLRLIFYAPKEKSEHNDILKTLRFSIAISFIAIHFFYSVDFFLSLKVSLILAIILPLLNSPTHRDALNTILDRIDHKDVLAK